MRVELTEIIWFEQQALSLPELAEISRLPQTVLEELLDDGVIAPIEPAAAEPRYGGPALKAARLASRLRTDFELETQALAVVLGLRNCRRCGLDSRIRSDSDPRRAGVVAISAVAVAQPLETTAPSVRAVSTSSSAANQSSASCPAAKPRFSAR